MARRNLLDDFTRGRMIGKLKEGSQAGQVSRFTMARRLHKEGLLARRPERCLRLKVDHRRHRLQWGREHKNWTTVNGVVSSLRVRVG
ncbi:hypothetical protein TNCV_2886111 [Trichonephila clavipes]|nr:hypothetical protein TNCV_2886111 [Trichonephila clavipes]